MADSPSLPSPSGSQELTPSAALASEDNPFNAAGLDMPDFSGLPLLPYLAGLPHPAYILPSPRLSSSSQPSLLAIWSNGAADELGQDLGGILTYRDSQRVKSLIASQDQADDELWAADEPDKGETASLASYSSLDRAALNSLEVEVSIPRWSKRRSYVATVQPSAHPSFFCLFLVPKAPARTRPRLWADAAKSFAGSASSDVQGTVTASNQDPSEAQEADTRPTIISNESTRLEWTSLRDQGPTRQPIAYDDDYRWSATEAQATTDWSKTPIGPPKQWPPMLSTLMNTAEAMPDMAAIWWYLGDEVDDWFMLHNSVYEERLRNAGAPHYGRVASDAWAGEHWPTLKARAHSCMDSGKGIWTDEDAFFVRTVETYWSWRWSPILGPRGEKYGILVTAFAETEKVLARRYLETSRVLASNLMTSRTVADLGDGLLRALELNERDFPWAALYHLKTETATGQKCDLQSEGTVTLAGTVGLPFDHPISPRQVVLDLSASSSSAESSDQWALNPALQRAFHTDAPVHLPDFVVELPEDLRQRSWGDVPFSACVYKISNLGEPSGRVSFLIVGLNPRRPFDKQYSDWLNDIQRAVLLTSRNISYMEDEKRKRTQLASLDRAKTAFFESCSHELRSPLHLVVGPLTDLEQSETSTSRKSQFALIQRNAARLQRLVNSILDFSQIETGQLSGRFAPTDLGRLTTDLAEVFRSSIEKGKIGYKVDCYGDASRLLYVDHSMWEKICYNLIGNAFKYTIRGKISVSCIYHPADEFEFRVTDTGVGIPKSEIDRVTERFHRVQSVSRSFEGTGLGLALCSELVQVLGGRLEIDSSTAAESPTGESGSTFSVFLKYGRGHLPEGLVDDAQGSTGKFVCSAYSKGIVDEAGRWATSNGSGSTRTNSSAGALSTSAQSDSGLSTADSSKVDVSTLFWDKSNVILLVDDSVDMLQYLHGVLAGHCQVLTAGDGDAALKILEKRRVDLVISDIQMPVLDGYGLLAAIRAHKDPDRAITPVILVSARAGDEERVTALLASADDVLPKPFSGKELVARAHMQVQLGKRRLELERNFRNESATTKLLSDLSPVGITRWRVDGMPVYANDAWYEQSGHPRDKPLSEWMDSIHPDHKASLAKMANDLFEGRKQIEGEWMWLNGRWSFCQAAIVSRHDDENFNGTICVLTDITERKRYDAERKLAIEAEEAHLRHRAETAEQRKKEADEQKRHQEFLVSVVSHETRNPVSAVIQCAGLCRSNLSFFRSELASSLANATPFTPTSELLNLLEEDIEALDNITEAALLIERIANDFLSLGKIQLATLEIFPTPCDLSAEFRKILGVFASEARLKGIHISLDLRGQLGLPNGQHVFLTDPVRLGQIIINLLSNAIRFTSASQKREITVALEVSTSAPSDDNCRPPQSTAQSTEDFKPGTKAYIYGAVTDSGPGLAPSELSKLFQRFSQASSSTHTVFGGSGLGLYICKLITGLLGGRIEVESVKGEGSTFRFFIATMTPDQGKGDISKVAEVKPILVPFPHVLVVEDNVINSRVLQRQLKKAGMTCEVAFDGKQGVDAIVRSFQEGQKRFNCVLCDVEMPIMDGREAVRAVRRMEAEGTLPTRSLVYALTGNGADHQIQDALAAGMDDIITKPYKIDVLLEKLRTSSQVV